MPAHAVSLTPGAAAATRQVFSAVSLARSPAGARARLEPGPAPTQSARPGLYNGRKAQWVVPALWL